MKFFTVKPRAQRDLAQHFAQIALDKITPAERLLVVANEAFQLLADFPGIGRSWESENPRLSGLRAYPLPKRFRNYLVFYRSSADGIEVVRVLHGARDIEEVLGDADSEL